jgi:uncharacterized Fe-S cluster-containing radical SAM superfamily protein
MELQLVRGEGGGDGRTDYTGIGGRDTVGCLCTCESYCACFATYFREIITKMRTSTFAT